MEDIYCEVCKRKIDKDECKKSLTQIRIRRMESGLHGVTAYTPAWKTICTECADELLSWMERKHKHG